MNKKVIGRIIFLFVVVAILALCFFAFNKKVKKNFNSSSVQNSNSNFFKDSEDNEEKNDREEPLNMKLYIKVNNQTLTATLYNNSSVNALVKKLQDKDLTIEMSDYANMEKVGSLGFNLPRNDESIETKPGDLILYQGNSFVIYYDHNSWKLTRLGKIDNVSQKELKKILKDDSVKVVLSLSSE